MFPATGHDAGHELATVRYGECCGCRSERKDKGDVAERWRRMGEAYNFSAREKSTLRQWKMECAGGRDGASMSSRLMAHAVRVTCSSRTLQPSVHQAVVAFHRTPNEKRWCKQRDV